MRFSLCPKDTTTSSSSLSEDIMSGGLVDILLDLVEFTLADNLVDRRTGGSEVIF
jgi:hypothetical protein